MITIIERNQCSTAAAKSHNQFLILRLCNDLGEDVSQVFLGRDVGNSNLLALYLVSDEVQANVDMLCVLMVLRILILRSGCFIVGADSQRQLNLIQHLRSYLGIP